MAGWRYFLREFAYLEDLESSLVSQIDRLHELQANSKDTKVPDAGRGMSLKAALAMAAPLGLPVPDDNAAQAQLRAGGGSSLRVAGAADEGAAKKSPELHALCECLAMLSRVCPDTCIAVRRISSLGADAGRALKDHFSQYGTVVRVLVVRANRRSLANCRPSGLAFVLMASAEVAQRLVALGEDEVGGVSVQLRRFVHKPDSAPRQPWEVGQGAPDSCRAAACAGPTTGRPQDDVPIYVPGFAHEPNDTKHHSNDEQNMFDVQQTPSPMNVLRDSHQGDVPIQVRDFAHKPDDTMYQSNRDQNMFDAYQPDMNFLGDRPQHAVLQFEHLLLQPTPEDISRADSICFRL